MVIVLSVDPRDGTLIVDDCVVAVFVLIIGLNRKRALRGMVVVLVLDVQS